MDALAKPSLPTMLMFTPATDQVYYYCEND